MNIQAEIRELEARRKSTHPSAHLWAASQEQFVSELQGKKKTNRLQTFIWITLAASLAILALSSCGEPEANPLNVSDVELIGIVGETYGPDMAENWGTPTTLEGTDADSWAAYFPAANISIVTVKGTNEIIYSERGSSGSGLVSKHN